MKVDVADCPSCGRKGVGLVRPFHSRREPQRAPKLARHGKYQDRAKGDPNPICSVGTGIEVLPHQIYSVSKRQR